MLSRAWAMGWALQLRTFSENRISIGCALDLVPIKVERIFIYID
jgi:hypothetical protein